MEKEGKAEFLDKYNEYSDAIDSERNAIKAENNNPSSSFFKSKAIVKRMNLVFYKYLPAMFEIIKSNDSNGFDKYVYNATDSTYFITTLHDLQESHINELQPNEKIDINKSINEGLQLITSLSPTLKLKDTDVYMIFNAKTHKYYVMDGKFKPTLEKILNDGKLDYKYGLGD